MSSKAQIVVLGFGDQARVIWESLQGEGKGRAIRCFINLEEGKHPATFWQGIPVFESMDAFLIHQNPAERDFIVALGSSDWRAEIFNKAQSLGMRTSITKERPLDCQIGGGMVHPTTS